MQAITKLREIKTLQREFTAGELVFSVKHNMQGRVLGVIRPAGLCIVGFGACGSAGVEPEQLRPVVRMSWFERINRNVA